ncbi:MAG TPA: endo alpha-1,4 polygalactosaminidase [Candidatus Acidoferrales bacterium]|nr:endo alpha-1,4 polygalactosaminidase [Candidatus Acidoferrales bacterium]
MRRSARHAAAFALLVAGGCGAGVSQSAAPPVAAQAGVLPAAARWVPAAGSSYQIQYDGNLDTAIAADSYDLDAFDTPAAAIARLHAQGRHAVCYVDVGTWERWRPDAKDFPKSVLGKPDGGWPGERWLDIRQTSILEPIMAKRYDMCESKGFDAIDPDNIDGYTNETGFPLTAAEQLVYGAWVAQAAHRRGLSVAQKNDNGQVAQIAKLFDFGVVEQCFVQHWCGQFAGYTSRGALVVDVEYGLKPQRFRAETCPSDARYAETAILKRLALTAWIVTCASP